MPGGDIQCGGSGLREEPRQIRRRGCRTAPMDPISVLRNAVDQTGRIVAGVKPDQLSGSTPCAEWDTHALLNHTIAAVEMFDTAAQTKPFNRPGSPAMGAQRRVALQLGFRRGRSD